MYYMENSWPDSNCTGQDKCNICEQEAQRQENSDYGDDGATEVSGFIKKEQERQWGEMCLEFSFLESPTTRYKKRQKCIHLLFFVGWEKTGRKHELGSMDGFLLFVCSPRSTIIFILSCPGTFYLSPVQPSPVPFNSNSRNPLKFTSMFVVASEFEL